MGRHDLLREAQQYAVNNQHAKALELLQRYLARCLAVAGGEDAAERAVMIEGLKNSQNQQHNQSSSSSPSSASRGAGRAGTPGAGDSRGSSWAHGSALSPSSAKDHEDDQHNNSSMHMASRVMSPPPNQKMCSDIIGAGKAYRNMGYVLLEMNQPKAALDAYEKGLKIARQQKDRRAEAKCLASMGAAYERSGQYDHCISLCSEAEVMCREASNPKGEGVAIANAAVALATMGQYKHSIRLHERALLMAQACSDVEGVDTVQQNLEATRDKKEKYEAALKSSTHF